MAIEWPEDSQADLLSEFVESDPHLVQEFMRWLHRDAKDFETVDFTGMLVDRLRDRRPREGVYLYIADGGGHISSSAALTARQRLAIVRENLEALREARVGLAASHTVGRLLAEDDDRRIEEHLTGLDALC